MITELNTRQKSITSAPYLLLMPGGKPVVREDTLNAGPKSRVWVGDTREELEAFALTLPPEPTPAERARDFYLSLSDAKKAKFAGLFQAVSAVENVKEKIRAIQAVTVEPDDESDKQRLLAILRGEQ